MQNLLKSLKEDSKYVELIEKIESNNNCSCFGLTLNEISFVLSFIKKQKIVVTTSVDEAYKLEKQLNTLGIKTMVLLQKIEDFTYNDFSHDEELKNIILTFYSLITKEVDCVIVLGKVLLQKFLDKDFFLEKIISLEKNKNYNFNFLIKNLMEIGYKKVDEICNKGEFTFKGDILSIFPLNSLFPIRISFFDDEIERICQFSLSSYEIVGDINKVDICPTHIYFYNEDEYQNLLRSIDCAQKETKEKETYEKLSLIKAQIENSINKIHSNFILPFIKKYTSTILDYLQDGVVVYLEPKLIKNSIDNEYVNFLSMQNSFVFEGRLLKEHKNSIQAKNELFKTTNTNLAFLNLVTSNQIFKSDSVYSFLTSFMKNYNYNLNFLVDDIISYRNKNYTIVLCAESNEKAINLQELLNKNNINSEIVLSQNQIKSQKVHILISQIYYGAIFLEEKLFLCGNFNIYGQKKEFTSQKVKKVFFTPRVGDYCVHETFGICKCKEIANVTFSNITKEYIVLEFFGGDTLFLPTEKTNLITKFVGDTENPKLNKLGSTEFVKEKTKVKEKVKTLAFDLLSLYAKRESTKGFAFKEDDNLQREFEGAFPYELTDDQNRAIKDVKRDMQSTKPMDRLICGDVGYGKTEVALRAAFKAILSGKQVAFLSPTTILCEQHYKNCLARMKSFMVNVDVLNRFKSNAEVKETLKHLEEGSTDIICGTHRLLSRDVKFKDLGLLILDEEQRFGVEDKEKIKNIKENIDVLTLSATPIPRTLNMSMIGIRDISIIDTPPKNRIPVQNIVTEYSKGLVIDAIERELKRDGQVLIVYNRVESISTFANTIKSYFPDVPMGVAHGQMDKKQLENIIKRVYADEIKILVSTVLIENGIDLPKANTIIVTHADKLGLSQLYQLRGRVGRSDIESYAYFTYESNMVLTEEGHKRLSALSEFSGLGSGFKIAMRDLEIRGAGSILGKEQSGHIEKVGYEMYTKILKEAIEELKGQKIKQKNDCKMEVAINSFIPKSYIADEENRLSLYEEISNLTSKDEFDKLYKTLVDKYLEVPEEVENLMRVAFLKNLLVIVNAKRFVLNEARAYIEFYEKEDILTEKISNILGQNKRTCCLNLSKMPIIEINTTGTIKQKLEKVINILIKE